MELPPDVHIFTGSKLPWLSPNDGARAFPAYYRTSDVWSEDSLRRLKVLVPTSPGTSSTN